MGNLLFFPFFVVSWFMARRSMALGVVAVLTLGYFFGITRANFLGTATYFMFDAAVAGLYLARMQSIFGRPATRRSQELWIAVLVLCGWPLLLLMVPNQDFWVRLVGLRGNIFLLPMLLIGARLSDDDTTKVARWLAALNIVALMFAVAEVVFGVQRFFPFNAVTEIIYVSHDIGGPNGLYRIPAIFSNASSYGGAMLMTLPFLMAAWVRRGLRWETFLLAGGILSAVLGVFFSASRTHFIGLALLATIFTFTARLRPIYRLGWIVLIVIAAAMVANNERLQRFTTLSDTEAVVTRLHGSVNTTLLQAIHEYPFGNGLGGGGTSIPYFLMDRVARPMLIENEYGRIVLEQGVIGLAFWLAFIVWAVLRKVVHRWDEWRDGRRLGAWLAIFMAIAASTGTGIFTAVPGSALFMLLLGWTLVPAVPRHLRQYFWETRQQVRVQQPYAVRQ
jgi:hypothetical protein